MGKIKTIIKEGVEAVLEARKEGIHNYENPTQEIEQLALKRLETCNDCLEEEPISWLKAVDERIPALSEKICKDCGCAAAYKFRQNTLKCSKWKE